MDGDLPSIWAVRRRKKDRDLSIYPSKSQLILFSLSIYLSIHQSINHAFIQAGGFLELQYVRIRQTMGMERDRYGLEGADLPSKVWMDGWMDECIRVYIYIPPLIILSPRPHTHPSIHPSIHITTKYT